ncbi:hypothetical protein MAHJHV47_26140 [Mycobacterium avium subsp. hominissuis]
MRLPSAVMRIRTARIAGIDRSGDQARFLESAHLRRHRRLRAVVDGGQVTDPGLAVSFDGCQQPGLRCRQRHLDALGGQPVEPRDHGEQVGPQSLPSLELCGVDDVVHVSMVA